MQVPSRLGVLGAAEKRGKRPLSRVVLVAERQARLGTVRPGLLGDSLDAFTPGECANYFTAAGYDAD